MPTARRPTPMAIDTILLPWLPNGLRLSGARRAPPSDDISPGTVCSGTVARVRCSRGLGAGVLRTANRIIALCHRGTRARLLLDMRLSRKATATVHVGIPNETSSLARLVDCQT